MHTQITPANKMIHNWLFRNVPILLLFTICLLVSRSAFPIPITLATGLSAIDADAEAPCGPYEACGVGAHLLTTSISYSSNLYFDTAFDAWNTNQAAGSKWSKVDGGALSGASLTVSKFEAISNYGVGGLEIQIDLTYTGSDRDDLVWIQGLNLNYDPPGTAILPPFSTMDDDALSNLDCSDPTIWCGPVYPYQYEDERFFDKPMAPYPTGFFEADALLAKADYGSRKLTVYEGVHYGFALHVVPEPASVFLFSGVLGLMAVVRRRCNTVNA